MIVLFIIARLSVEVQQILCASAVDANMDKFGAQDSTSVSNIVGIDYQSDNYCNRKLIQVAY